MACGALRQQLFPAYAGVILERRLQENIGEAFPRIRGGDPINMEESGDPAAFSPHTRG